MSKGFKKFLTGAALGVGLGFLLAPEKGEKTREKVMNASKNLMDEIKKLDYDDVKDNLEKKVADLEEEFKSLDAEKVSKIATEKGKVILKKANEIYKEAVKQGKPIIEKYASELKTNAENFINDITEDKSKNTKTKKNNDKK